MLCGVVNLHGGRDHFKFDVMTLELTFQDTKMEWDSVCLTYIFSTWVPSRRVPINLNHHHWVSAPSTFWATQVYLPESSICILDISNVPSLLSLYFSERVSQLSYSPGEWPSICRSGSAMARQSRKTVVPISMFKWFGKCVMRYHHWEALLIGTWLKTSFTCCPLYSGGMAQNIDKGSWSGCLSYWS